jgi:hypothetical protein
MFVFVLVLVVVLVAGTRFWDHVIANANQTDFQAVRRKTPPAITHILHPAPPHHILCDASRLGVVGVVVIVGDSVALFFDLVLHLREDTIIFRCHRRFKLLAQRGFQHRGFRHGRNGGRVSIQRGNLLRERCVMCKPAHRNPCLHKLRVVASISKVTARFRKSQPRKDAHHILQHRHDGTYEMNREWQREAAERSKSARSV